MINRRTALKLGSAAMLLPGASLAVPFGASIAQESSGSVTMFRGDLARTGTSPSPGPDPSKPIGVKWLTETASPHHTSPLVMGNTVFVATEKAGIQALNRETGEILWVFPGEGADPEDLVVRGTPAIADGTVYFGTRGRTYFAIDAETGEERWHVDLDHEVRSSSLVVEGVVYFGTASEPRLFALDAQTGEELWSFEDEDTSGFEVATPSFWEGNIYAGSSKGLIAINAQTGELIWRFATTGLVQHAAAIDDGVAYFGDSRWHFYAVSTTDGSEVWRYNPQGIAVTSSAVSDGRLYVPVSSRNGLAAVDTHDGSEIWAFETEKVLHSAPMIAEGIIYFGSYDGRMYAVDTATGEGLWHFQTDDEVQSSPVVVDGVIYIGSHDGWVYAIANMEPPRFNSDTSIRARASDDAEELRAAKAGDEIFNIGDANFDGETLWLEVMVDDVTGWVPSLSLDETTTPAYWGITRYTSP